MKRNENEVEKKTEASIDLQKQLEYESERLKYDTQAKRLFGLKEVMGYILKFMVPEFQTMSAEESAECILEVQVSQNEVSENYGDGSFQIKKQENTAKGSFQKLQSESKVSNEKTIYYDIKTLVKNPKFLESQNGTIEFIINLEMQNDNEPGYVIEQRGMYCCSRLLSEQLGVLTETTDYSKLKKVYSLWIVGGTAENKLYTYCMTDQDGEKDHSANLIELRIVRLSKEVYETENQELFDFLHGFFDIISLEDKTKRMSKYFDFDKNRELKEGVDTMCNLSEGIYNIGKEEGRERGLEQGLERGLEQGREEGILIAAKMMVKKGMPLEVVAESLEIPKEVIEQYLKK